MIKDDIDTIRGVLGSSVLEGITETLNEMKLSSVIKTADFWDQRQNIEKWQLLVSRQHAKVKTLKAHFEDKERKLRDLQISQKRSLDGNSMQELLEDIKAEKLLTATYVEDALDLQEDVDAVIKDMDECDILRVIGLRTQQVNSLIEKLNKINGEFKDLREADVNFEGSAQSEKEIKAVVEKLEKKLVFLNNEEETIVEQHKTKIQPLVSEHYKPDKASKVLKDLRGFKEQIDGVFTKIPSIESLLDSLNDLLIAQDIQNASKLMGQQL